MSSVPRDAGYYHPTGHAKQRRKYRDIDWEFVALTIEEGEVRKSHKTNCRVFRKEFQTVDPVKVIANIETGEIVTVCWDYNND